MKNDFLVFSASDEQEESKVKITENEACTLTNQVIQTNKIITYIFSSILQYLRVEIDAQGNLQHIVNLQKSFDITFDAQGFYWYQSKSIVITNSFIFVSSFFLFRLPR